MIYISIRYFLATIFRSLESFYKESAALFYWNTLSDKTMSDKEWKWRKFCRKKKKCRQKLSPRKLASSGCL